VTRSYTSSPAERRHRLNRRRRAAEGWPYCEHDGAERIIATAAEHVIGIKGVHLPPPMERGLIRGIEGAAGESGPEDRIGLCPECYCITWRSAPAHR